MDFDDDDDGLFETVDLVEEEDEPLPKPGPSSGGIEGSLTFKGLRLLGAAHLAHLIVSKQFIVNYVVLPWR